MKKKINILLIVTLFLFAACEHEIPYKLDPVNPKLTMNALINIQEEQNILYLNYTGKSNAGNVENATVEVRVNGKLTETCQPMEYLYPGDAQKRFLITTAFSPGDAVRIDAYTPDEKHHVYIEETVPQPPVVLGVDTLSVSYPLPYLTYIPSKQMRFNIRIKDHPGNKNYYRIMLEHHLDVSGITNDGRDTIARTTYFDLWPWDDIVLTDGRPATTDELEKELIERIKNIYGIFDDSRFADSEYTMVVSTSYQYNNFWVIDYTPKLINIHTKVRLLSITEDQYYYLNIMNFIDSGTGDEYLTEPVKIPSNVRGGTGFVGFSSEVNTSFHIIKDKPAEYYDNEDNENHFGSI